MFPFRHQRQQIDDVDKPHPQLGEFLPQNGGGGEGFHGGNIATAGHDDIRFVGVFAAIVVAGPFPNTDALGAVGDRLLHA